MINNLADYRFVQGDIGSMIVDGGVMPLRDQDTKKMLRGEDICFMAEAHEARTALWDGAVFKMSGNTYTDSPADVTISSQGQVFDFTKHLSITQLSTVAHMHEIDSAKRPGAGSAQACSPFFLKQMPNVVSGDFDSKAADFQNELANMVQDAALVMPPANLNGQALLQNEVECMFIDNSLFRLYGCGMADSNYGFGIGSDSTAEVFEDDPDGRIGSMDTKHCIFNLVGITYNGSKGIKETWPSGNFTMASFDDDGDVDSAEMWASLVIDWLPSGSSSYSYSLYFGKVCDFHLEQDQAKWIASRSGTAWRAFLRALYRDVVGVTLPSSTSDLPSANYSVEGNIRMYTPFAVVRPKDRFIW